METKENKKGKKKIRIILAIVAIILVVFFLIHAKMNATKKKSAESAGNTETSTVGTVSNYYNGIIEPQKTWDIQKDSDKTVAEVYVKEGDTVTAGQKLFMYKTDDVSLQVKQGQIEIEGYNNQIADDKTQIQQLQTQKAAAAQDEQLGYESQIQQLQNDIAQANLNKKMKQAEIENTQKTAGNAVVTSTMNGVVKKINNNTQSSDAFMTILATGNYQVKGTVDETNIGSLKEGMKVKVRSRSDDKKSWDGTISKIDTDTAQSSTASSTSQETTDGTTTSSSSSQATKYTFYVSLDTTEQLLLGQHVYVEPVEDTSDTEVAQ